MADVEGNGTTKHH